MPLAQTPGPDLAYQDAVMESEAFISSENSCISTSRRTRAGWLIGHEYMCLVCEITLRTCDISEMSRQGRPMTWPLTGSFQNGLLPLGPELEAEWLEAEGRPKP